MNDSIIRSAFHTTVLKKAHAQEGAFVIDELGLKNGESRADIAVLNGKLIGYEIKTEKDNLNRLAGQVKAYSEVFDKAYIITSSKHLAKVIETIPEWWGIYLILDKPRKGYTFATFRKATSNKHKDSYGLVQLLWKSEVIEILNVHFNQATKARQTKDELYYLLAEQCSITNLSQIVLHYLKSRDAWRTNP